MNISNQSASSVPLRRGFSLIEVVIATGLCTYALLVIAALLPVGMITIQNASGQIIETEIFNRLWSQFNTTPFYSLQNTNNGVTPLFASPTTPLYYYYDQEGQNVSATSAVYVVRCTLVNSQTSTSLEMTSPVVDGGAATSGPSLTFIQVQIGFHFDPANLSAGKSDPRVTTRTFLISKRDTWDGS